jgi:hypothetical protein
MRFQILSLAVFLALNSQAAEKKLPIEQTSNELVEVSATAVIDKEQIKQEIGSDLGGDIVLVRVQLRPVSDKPVRISHDDFLLICTKDGQRSQPFEPSQIAGSSSLVVTQTGVRNGRTRTQAGLGGIIGIGGGGIGNATTSPQTDTKVEEKDSGEKDNPVLTALKQKVLPEKEINDPLAGYLYFQIEGKFKSKDLELRYKTPTGQLALRFRDKDGK